MSGSTVPMLEVLIEDLSAHHQKHGWVPDVWYMHPDDFRAVMLEVDRLNCKYATGEKRIRTKPTEFKCMNVTIRPYDQPIKFTTGRET